MSWDWFKQGGPVSNVVGGGLDFVTGGMTDFDGRGSGGYNWMPGTMGKQFNPIFGGSDQKWGPAAASAADGFSLGDAIQSFTKGYGSQIGSGASSTPGGSQFLNAYTAGKGSTPTTTSPVSTSDVFTAGGGTHSIGDSILIKEQPDWYAFKDQPEYPVGAYMGPGGSTAKKPSKIGGIVSGAASGFAAGGVPGAIFGGLGGLFS